MPPKADKAPTEDPSVAADAAVATALESLQSDDPAALVQGLESLSTTLATEVGEAAVRRQCDALLPSLIRLAAAEGESGEPTLLFFATLAKLPWGSDALVLNGGLVALMGLVQPPPPAPAPAAEAPAEAPAAEAPDEAPAEAVRCGVET